jgi:hypothetical protein
MDTTKQKLIDRIEHLEDDLAKVEGNIRRVLREEIRMLNDGLQAVESHGASHLHILVDHAERSRANLINLLTATTGVVVKGRE